MLLLIASFPATRDMPRFCCVGLIAWRGITDSEGSFGLAGENLSSHDGTIRLQCASSFTAGHEVQGRQTGRVCEGGYRYR